MSKQDLNRFYVYAYLRSKDSEHGKRLTPYYIGKGNGYRAFSRQRRTTPVPKDKAFIVFIQEGLTEKEAFALEKYCIALYGRLDQGKGILRNLCDGGEGSSGMIVSAERRERMAKDSKDARTREGRWRGDKNPKAGGDPVRGDKNPMWGKNHSGTTKSKIGERQRAYRATPEGKIMGKLKGQKYLYELIDPDGEVYVTENLFDFSKQYGLTNASMNKVVNGKSAHHKGWTGRIVEKLR
jgi:hypothetical protein